MYMHATRRTDVGLYTCVQASDALFERMLSEVGRPRPVCICGTRYTRHVTAAVELRYLMTHSRLSQSTSPDVSAALVVQTMRLGALFFNLGSNKLVKYA